MATTHQANNTPASFVITGAGNASSDYDPLLIDEPDWSDVDPSCKDGFRVVYEKEIPFEMRLQENDQSPEVGTLEAILAKVSVQGEASLPTMIKVELSSESDLFFHYSHVLDERSFKTVREEQRLMIEFSDYANVLARSLNQAIKEPQTHLAVFIMNRDGQARLDFIQNMEYKFVELLSVTFLRSPDDRIRSSIAFRYNSIKTKLQIVSGRLSEVTSIVKLKNPSLLLQLQQTKTVPMTGTSQSGGPLSGASAQPAPKRL